MKSARSILDWELPGKQVRIGSIIGRFWVDREGYGIQTADGKNQDFGSECKSIKGKPHVKVDGQWVEVCAS